MYAVIESGGKQFRVELGTTLEVDRLDVEPGTTLTIDRVLLVADGDTASIGRPTVADATVSAAVVGPIRGEKVISFKYRPKARRRVKKGHRSELTVLRITDITFGGKSAAAEDAKAAEAKKTERDRLAEAAARQAEADAALAKKLADRTATADAGKAGAAAPPTKGRAKAAPKAEAASKAKPATKEAPAPKAEAPAAKPEAIEAEAPAAKSEGTAEEAPTTAEEKPKRTRRAKSTDTDAASGTTETTEE